MDELLASIIKKGLELKASDIHLRYSQRPLCRIDGNIQSLDDPVLLDDHLLCVFNELLDTKLQSKFKLLNDLDFAKCLSLDVGVVRVRVNVFVSQGHLGFVIRLINSQILELDTLGFPDFALEKIKKLLCSPRGLFLVVGPTGSGKSTTLAAMIDFINKNFKKHIITIEDPIEYIYQSNRSIITQRELGKDTPSFQKALAGALRQDPDVILLGEMRDLVTIEAAVSAAETGHLVLSTLHTTGSMRTVDRIIDAFPDSSRDLVRTQLASNLIGVISQTLCRKKGGSGRLPAFEIMFHSDAIANLIRENKTFRIQTEIEVGQNAGMLPLDKHLFQLWQQGAISDEEALSVALDPAALKFRMNNVTVTKQKKSFFSF